MSIVEEAADRALGNCFSDAGFSQDVVEVFMWLLNGYGMGTQDNIVVCPNWTWFDFEEEFKFVKPGCFLLLGGWPSVSLPNHADLVYPVPYGVFCDKFQEFLDSWFYPEQKAMRPVVDPLLAQYRHDLETLSDDEWRKIMKNYDPRRPLTSGRTAESFGVPPLEEPWPRIWTNKRKGPRRILKTRR